MKRIAKNLPEPNWEPPVGAWESLLPENLQSIISYVGCQGDEGQCSEFRRHVANGCSQFNGKTHIEYAQYVDAEGVQNAVAIIYCFRRSDYVDLKRKTIDPLLETNTTGAGYWVECFPIDRKDIETLFSSDDQNPGIASFGSGVGDPIQLHGYYGSMRDRLYSSNESDHASPLDSLIRVNAPAKAPAVVNIESPSNLCAIRSGQDWSKCQGAQRDFYLNELAPVLKAGMKFLQDNPIETGCISCRFMTETDENGNEKDRTFGYALFKDIADLEAWAKSHPTHIAIFDKFMEYAVAFDNKIDLRLWHEVLVMPECETFSYVNCSPITGLLPYFK